MDQVGDAGDIVGHRARETWPDLEHLLNMKLTGFIEGLDIL